jgi:hypothetical protein
VVLIFAMIFLGSAFGLDNVLPGAIIGAGCGLVGGLCFPKPAGKVRAELLAYF